MEHVADPAARGRSVLVTSARGSIHPKRGEEATRCQTGAAVAGCLASAGGVLALRTQDAREDPIRIVSLLVKAKTGKDKKKEDDTGAFSVHPGAVFGGPMRSAAEHAVRSVRVVATAP